MIADGVPLELRMAASVASSRSEIGAGMIGSGSTAAAAMKTNERPLPPIGFPKPTQVFSTNSGRPTYLQCIYERMTVCGLADRASERPEMGAKQTFPAALNQRPLVALGTLNADCRRRAK